MPLGADAVVVTDLVKRFGRFTAVDRVTFSVRPGEIFGFLGPNGAGKSTTIRMLCGIIAPTSGAGQVAGFDLFTESERIKQSIGYMSQKFSLYPDLTPFENIRFYLGIYNVPPEQWAERIQWVFGVTRLSAVRDRLTRELPPGWRSAWPWDAPCCTGRGCFSWTSPPPVWTPSRGGISGISSASSRPKGHGLRYHPLHGRSPALRPGGHDQRRPDRGERAAGRDRGPRAAGPAGR